MTFDDPCERCDARVKQRGDHICPSCAEALARDVRSPWWGAFPGTADALAEQRRAA